MSVARVLRRASVILGAALLLLAATELIASAAVSLRWDNDLGQAVQNATKIRVRTGGTCHRHPDNETVLAETSDPNEIRRVAGAWRFSLLQPWMQCRCCGGPTIEFYRDSDLLAAVSVQHGTALRWDGHPSFDARLTSGGASVLQGWLKSIGADRP